MMRRLPIVPTLVVVLAAAAMIALGVWQLQRKAWKESLLAQYGANLHLPPVDFPRDPMGHDELLFRKSSALCRDPGGWERQAGHAQNGETGWLLIAHCRSEGSGSGFKLALGVTSNPTLVPDWKGGQVSGVITHAPGHGSLIGALFTKPAPQELMLVADAAPPPLATSVAPDPSTVPNNHLAYAGQWFLFAGIAVVIYALALRRRWRTSS
jgi:cytochrome oxidase assembly protein ShyY1